MRGYLDFRAMPINTLEKIATNPDFLKHKARTELKRRSNIYGHHWKFTNKRASEALARSES